MKLTMQDHLPVVSVVIEYRGRQKLFDNVLLDTGCGATILDTDLCEEMGLYLDLAHAVIRKMYGIGGTEICIEQTVGELIIDDFPLTDFTLQLGAVKDVHGFDGILGSDFLNMNKMVIDFSEMEVRKR